MKPFVTSIARPAALTNFDVSRRIHTKRSARYMYRRRRAASVGIFLRKHGQSFRRQFYGSDPVVS